MLVGEENRSVRTGVPVCSRPAGPPASMHSLLSKCSRFAPKSHMARQSVYITRFDREEGGGASLFYMRHRPCPFCCNESFSIFGARGDLWVRCRGCRSVFRDITAEKFEQLHGEAFQDTHFLDSHIAASGLEPRSTLWDELALPGASLLEIGPGTGHLLAAAHKAGRSVTAVESSEVHRAFIRKTWYPLALPRHRCRSTWSGVRCRRGDQCT